MISAKRVLLTLALIVLPAACLPAGATAAPAGPAWNVSTQIVSPTNLIPGSTGENLYVIVATNVGSQSTSGPFSITDELPEGVTLNPDPPGFGVTFNLYNDAEETTEVGVFYCDVASVSCGGSTQVHPGQQLYMQVPVDVAPGAPPVATNRVAIAGGGAAPDSDTVQSEVTSELPPFGIRTFQNALLDRGGDAETRAGAHPYQMRIGAQFNLVSEGEPVENPKNLTADLPAGLVINPEATPVRCTEAQLVLSESPLACPDASAVGLVHVTANAVVGQARAELTAPLYNMIVPQGHPAELGFNVAGLGIFVHLFGRIRSDGDYGLSSDTFEAPQFGGMSGVSVDLWGDPSDPSHNYRRGQCGFKTVKKACPVNATKTALLTMPTACSGPLKAGFTANSWQHSAHYVSASSETEDAAGNPVGVSGCEKLSYNPKTETTASTERAETGSGFDFNIDFPNNGLKSPSAISESLTQKAVVTLPEGLTINPSVGEGLGYCAPAQYAKETAFTLEGEGCPSDSKIGTLFGETPLLNKGVNGTVYLAQQDNPATTQHGAENPFDSLIALYLVLKNPALGVIVKRPLLIEPDPRTGQLVATLEDLPQLPFNHANFHFREGARAALVTPATCGKYTTVAKLYPSADPTHPLISKSSFEITKGVGGSACPPGGVPPFHPRFQAGSVNNSAGAFSPFNMSLTRADGEQDMTKFSAILPPGELGSLAGVSKCSDAAIALAKTKTGREELASSSCPANSLIGHTLAGAGVGEALTYVPGQLYLGGAYHGDPLSVISITPGVAGPFDAGTVVVRLALTLNPKTAEVEVDGANSDPIPHILKGIVLKVRDLRVYVDRPNFTLNPTSCDPSKVNATLFGADLNVFDPADDVPIPLSTRYQAADCQSLGYRPSIALQLKGGTKRGGHPGLLATYKARKGDANTKGLVIRLPRSAFLDQGHIRTICTRVQFAAKSCPPAAQYGYIKAFTPLLDDPLEGPVWLRSSNHKLPDLVFDLHGLVDVEVSTRIDSAHGGIRASIESAPDAPLTKVVLSMQGGKKGLIVNSRNLCGKRSRANVELEGQNGKESRSNPVMKADCGGKRKHKRAHGRG